MHKPWNVDRIAFELLFAREGQHVLCERGAAPGSLPRAIEKRQLWVFRETLAHQFEAAQDRHEQIVEIVRYPSGEPSDRLHLLRLKQGILRFFEFLLRLFSFGQVPRDFRGSITSPLGARIGSITTEAQKRDPSLRTRHPSLSNLPSLAAFSSASAARPLALSSSV